MSSQNLAALLRARKAFVIGEAATLAPRTVLQQLQSSASALEQVRTRLGMHTHLKHAADASAFVFDPDLVNAGSIESLARQGCRGVVWAAAQPIPQELLQAARPHRLRFLGARTAGYFHSDGLRAGTFPAATAVGGLALIAQSGSIAAAAVDWAAGRDIGFSWAVTTGAEADADVADFLDLAALDPQTRAVVLQLGRVQSARKFMSAARACARLKPVVVLQSRVGGREGLSGPDPVRSAAFARAGLVECATLDGLFDALAAMAQVPVRNQARVLTLGNGAGMCALGVDAVLRHGLELARCSDTVFQSLRARTPAARNLDGALDLGTVSPTLLVQTARTLLADEQIDYLLLVQSPSLSEAHEPYVTALIDAQLGPRVVTVWLGLASAVAARRRSAEAGLATFVTAGQAARALSYRWLHGRTRELLMQTPPPRAPREYRRSDAQALLDTALAGGAAELDAAAADRLLDCYALPPADADPTSLRFEFGIARHAELGTHLTVAASSDLLRSTTGLGIPPLDGLLAQRMLESLRLPLAPELRAALGGVIYALSQMALDLPAVRELRVCLSLNEAGGLVRTGRAGVTLDAAPPDPRARLMLAPYPEHLRRLAALRNGRRYRLRPILPEDEPALVALLQRLRPEDIRLRFFASIRYFSHEMAARMTQIDYDRELVLVAAPDGDEAALCAVAHLVTDPYGEQGEFAVLVHHDHAGSGLGRELMQELLAHAKRHGLRRVYGDVLRENGPMLALARRVGFRVCDHEEEPDCRRVEIDL